MDYELTSLKLWNDSLTALADTDQSSDIGW